VNIDRYLKKHWVNFEYDCWSLVREFYFAEFNIDLPYIPIDASDIDLVSDTIRNSDLRGLFQSIKTPSNGCVVELERRHRQPNKSTARHVGVFIDPNFVLHNSGVVQCVPISRIQLDWTILGYFLHVSDRRIPQCTESE
jgi:NlpC/P60 family